MILNKILIRIAKYNSQLIKIFENKKIETYGKKESKNHPIFIIGAPRSGSTLLYQLITNKYDILYINNLIDYFHRNFFFGFWLSNKFLKNKPHNCFISDLGNTEECGLRAPSECASFWYRWIPGGKHFVDVNDISSNKILEIKKSIYSVINYHNKKLVFKNMNAGMRLRLLKQIAPELKLIFIKRDPVLTAYSLLKARKKYYNDKNIWWSIKPREYNKIKNLKNYQQVVKQIFYIEKQIYNDINLFPKENLLIINYDEIFCDLDNLLKRVYTFLGNDLDQKKPTAQIPKLKITSQQNLNVDLLNLIKSEVKKLDWHDYKS